MRFIGVVLYFRQGIEEFVGRNLFLGIGHMKDVAEILGVGSLVEAAHFKSNGVSLHRLNGGSDVAGIHAA